MVLDIHPGKKIAIVGPAGAGKSSLFQLLLKHRLPDSGHRSLLVITHQLTGLEAFDEILFMEKGKIIERGTCQELVMRKARFYKMRTQSLLFAEDIKKKAIPALSTYSSLAC